VKDGYNVGVMWVADGVGVGMDEPNSISVSSNSDSLLGIDQN